ncbi:MAG: hypothetical protein AB1585_13640 [Thermodesulfobacteriota bacterium]
MRQEKTEEEKKFIMEHKRFFISFPESKDVLYQFSLFKILKIIFCHRQRRDEVAATCRPLTARPFGHLNPPSRQRGLALPGIFLVEAGQNIFRPAFVRVRPWQKHF